MNRLGRWLSAAGLAAMLAACGGGGGGGDSAADAAPVLEAPPATAAALQGNSAEASGAAGAAADSAQRLVQLSASLNGDLLPLASSGSSAVSWSRAALSASRSERALATQTLSCAEFFRTTACSGSVQMDTNASGSGSVLPAGTYVSMTFSALQGSFGGAPVLLNGTLRLDYLTAFDVNASSLAGLRFQLAFSGFSGSADGVTFGPLSEIALYEFDGQGAGHVTIDGLRITGFDTMSVTDADNYSLPNVTARRAHWAAPAGHVDMQFVGWSVADARPAVGSLALVSAGSNSVRVEVASTSAASVEYAIRVQVNGVTTDYTVTATYPAGGGAPSYTVVATPT